MTDLTYWERKRMQEECDRISCLESAVNTLESDRDRLARLLIKLCERFDRRNEGGKLVDEVRSDAQEMLDPYR